MKEAQKVAAKNLDKQPLKIAHADLERDGKHSAFRSVCPTCKLGVLLVQRDQKTLRLIAEDRCILCGQAVIYTDIEKLKAKFEPD